MLARRMGILAVVSVVAVAACSDNPTEPEVGLEGTYLLTAVNGMPPPVVVYETSVDSTSDVCYGVEGVTSYEQEVTSSTADFTADGSANVSLRLSHRCLDSDGRVLTDNPEATSIKVLWTHSGNSITLSFPWEQDVPAEWPQMTGHFDPAGVAFTFPFGIVDGGYSMAELSYEATA